MTLTYIVSMSRIRRQVAHTSQGRSIRRLFSRLAKSSMASSMRTYIYAFKDLSPYLKVDIPSDLSQRLLHTIHNQLYFPSRHANRQAKDLVAFDEAQSIVVRHLLPFWAGFAKQYRPSTSTLGVVAGRRRKQMTNKIGTKKFAKNSKKIFFCNCTS